MARTYKNTRKGFSWGYRKIKGYRRSKQNHKEIRPKARVPNPWDDIPYDALCSLPFKVAFALHKKGWDDERIRRHLQWKFNLRRSQAEEIVGDGYWWRCECEKCQEYRRNRYNY